MLRVARGLTRDITEAEDLVQDALLRAYRGIDRFDGRHPRAWLLTIVRNTHINRGRRQRPEPVEDPADAFDRQVDVTAPSVVEDAALASTFDASVEEAFLQLPAAHQRVVELVDMAGLTYREVADLLDVPVGTVMSRLHRARRRLRDQLVAAGFVGRGSR